MWPPSSAPASSPSSGSRSRDGCAPSSTRCRRAASRALEVTMTVPGAVELIRRAGADACPSGFLLGAGHGHSTPTTVARVDRRRRAVRRQPGVPARGDRRLPRARRRRRCPAASRPTEILDAWEAGADIVKVFPATALGPGYLKDVRGPLPQVKLMPTGGVTLDNAGDWIRAGAVAVGVGTALIDAKAIAAGDYATLRAQRRADRRERARRAGRQRHEPRSSRSARSCCG